MQTFDLHVVSIPDHRAQVAVANLIVATNRSISMQTAMDMARNPPLQLCHNLDMADAEKYKDKLNGLGVGFRFAPVESDLPYADGNSLDEFAGIKQHNESIDKVPDNGPEKKSPAPVTARITAGGAAFTGGAGGKAFTPGYMPQGRNIETAGVHTGGSTLSALRKQEQKAKRTSILFSLAALIIVLIVLYFVTRDGKEIALPNKEQAKALQESRAKQQEQQKQTQGGGASGGQQRAGAATDAQPQDDAQYTETRQPTHPPQRAPAGSDNARSRVSSQQKQEANNYIDSARAAASPSANTAPNAHRNAPAGAAQKTLSNNIDEVIRFYRIAISFNRYNLAAWQGLLQAYRDKGMTKEARETEEQMRALFGDRVNSVGNIVKPLGELVDTYMSEGGIYRVEYKTLKRTRTDILNEVFIMTRSVRTACACEKISIFAATGPGRGMLVQSTPATSVHSLSAFQSQAEITWLD